MKRFSLNRLSLIAFCCALMLATGCGETAPNCSVAGTCTDTDLLSVVAISRHGIRSPTSSQATMDSYTQQPQSFPLWPFPADTAGQLSTKGQQNATLLGSWYRDFYVAQGLLPARGTCPAADTVFVYADGFERTVQTGQGYLDGMFQGEATADCGFQVNISLNKPDPPDPYIDTVSAKICAIDIPQDQAAFNERIGGSPQVLIDRNFAALNELQAVTHCCQPSACATPANPNPASCSLGGLPTTVRTTESVAFASGSLFYVADNVTETFGMEYAQGMPDANCPSASGTQCVGWGAIPPNGLFNMSELHVENMVNLTCQLPSFAGWARRT